MATPCDEMLSTCATCGGPLDHVDSTLCTSQRMCEACQNEADALEGERNYREGAPRGEQ